MSTISSNIAMLLVSLLNNDPVHVDKYMNENIQVPVAQVGHSLEDLEEIKQRDLQLHELSDMVSELTNNSEKIMHLIAALDVEDFSDGDILTSLKKLHTMTEEVIKVSKKRFESSEGLVKSEHEKVLYYTTVFNTYIFALIDEDLQKITGFKRTVPTDMFKVGKDLYSMDKKAEEMLA